MSKKLQQALNSKEKKHEIETHETGFITDIDNMQNTMNYYYDELKRNYLQQIAMRLGYTDQVEVSIDLGSDKREVIVKKI